MMAWGAMRLASAGQEDGTRGILCLQLTGEADPMLSNLRHSILHQGQDSFFYHLGRGRTWHDHFAVGLNLPVFVIAQIHEREPAQVLGVIDALRW